MAALWEKIIPWKKKMNKPQYDIDYTLVESNDGTKTGIGIKTGKYSGILYHYGKVRLTEEDNYARLTFVYNIVESPTISVDDLVNDKEFLEFMGDILSDILMNQEKARQYMQENDEQELLVWKNDEET
jgi:hypothetical protein